MVNENVASHNIITFFFTNTNVSTIQLKVYEVFHKFASCPEYDLDISPKQKMIVILHQC